jgi:hypothetical protein
MAHMRRSITPEPVVGREGQPFHGRELFGLDRARIAADVGRVLPIIQRPMAEAPD